MFDQKKTDRQELFKALKNKYTPLPTISCEDKG